MPVPTKDKHVSTHVTVELHRRLERLSQDRKMPIAEIVREALRAYLDEQQDVEGSRKHFTKTMGGRFDYLEWLLTLMLLTVANGLTYLIGAATGSKVTPNALIDQSIQQSKQRDSMLRQAFLQRILKRKDER